MMLLLCHQCRCLLMIREMKELIVDGCLLCVFFLLSSQLRSNSVNVVFDFNASLNDVAPVSLILLPVYVLKKEKSELLMDFSCVFFLFLFSLSRSSLESVAFDFSASLNDVTPVSPILLSAYVIRKGLSDVLMNVFCVSSFFYLNTSDRVQ